jgi:hypothetical protein
MLLIILLWFGISAPLSAIGAYFGGRRGVRLGLRLRSLPHSYAVACRQFPTLSGSIQSLVKSRRLQGTYGRGYVVNVRDNHNRAD